MKKLFLTAFGCLLILPFSSCTHRLTDFTVISTKNYPIEDNRNLKVENTRVKGKDLKHTILFVPLGVPNLKEALDKAIEGTPGCVGLANGVVKSSGWNVILYGQSSYIVEGNPIVLHEGESNLTQQQVNSLRNQTQTQGQQSQGSVMFYHQVSGTETLASIAQQYNVTIADIIKWNKLSSSKVKVGDKLLIYL
jgi:LysM repeat protein